MQQKFFFHTFPYPQGRNSIEQKWILISYWDFLWENLTSLTIRKFSRLLAQFFFILSFWYSVHVLFKSYAMQNPCSFDYNDSILNLKQQRSVSKQKNQTFLVLVNEKRFGLKFLLLLKNSAKSGEVETLDRVYKDVRLVSMLAKFLGRVCPIDLEFNPRLVGTTETIEA